MEWKEYEEKQRFRRVITNTFSSNEDCEMFIMVLKQQWPKHINKLPDVNQKLLDRQIHQILWLQSGILKIIRIFYILEKIGNEIIYP